MKKYDVAIVGGGAVGCAIAYELMRYSLSVALFERCPDVAMGTSGKNSGVVHAGFNNRPGSLMAKLCVEGNKAFAELCKRLDVPYERTGKLVVAFDEGDMSILNGLVADAKKNQCVGIEMIDRKRMEELEPNIGGIGAMLSSNTAIFDPFLYTIHLCEAAMQNGAEVFVNSEVVDIKKEYGKFIVETSGGTYASTILINSAGLYSDRIAAMAGHPGYTIYPCRGQYLILDKHVSELVHRPVYPAPHKGVGGLGVHLTSSVTGSVLVGPSADYIKDKENYSSTGDVSEQLFQEAQQLLPQLTRSMVIGAYTGTRSKLVAKGDANFGDFIIEESDIVENLINLIGIESPGMTASMPIAKMVVEILRKKWPLDKNRSFIEEYSGIRRFRDLSIVEQDELIQKNPDYGEIICRCEGVTKAELKQALHNPLKAYSLISIKNRIHAMMGRCQGGYCMTRIINIMMEEMGIEPEHITYRYDEDCPFPGKVKK